MGADREKIIIKPETQEVRPFVVAAILRNIKFDLQSYNSFIDL
jgi:phenylalanyl-tRNA synthetase beta chain